MLQGAKVEQKQVRCVQGFSSLGDWVMKDPWKEELDLRSADEYCDENDAAVSTLATTSLCLTLTTMVLQLFDGSFPAWFR